MDTRRAMPWRWAAMLLGVLYAAAVLHAMAFATSDGPIHMNFGRLMGGVAPGDVLQAQHYERNGALVPNIAVYWLIPLLLGFCPPALAEAIVQLLCLLGLVGATAFMLSQFDRSQTWIALFAFPLALHQLFFLGLYNYCLSLIGFLLAIGALLWMEKGASPWRMLAPAAALYFSYFAHASGFLAAVVALGVLTLAQAGAAWRAAGLEQGADKAVAAHAARWRAVMPFWRHAAVLLSPLPVMLLAHGAMHDAPVVFGAGLDQRLKSFAILSLLNLRHTPLDRFLVPAVACAMLGSVVLLAVRRGKSAAAVAALALFAGLLLLALGFPDTMGGGWTHFRRMQMFPYFASLLCMAALRPSLAARNALAAVAVCASLVLLAGGAWRQDRIKQQLAPLAEVDRLVGAHCSVLPLVLDDGGAWTTGMLPPPKYRPFFHAASRLELTNDRVVLFNYLARLDVYPVRVRSGLDPQHLIFHWQARQEETAILRVDIARYERASGRPVDYVLQWGALEAAAPPLRAEVRRALLGYRPVYAGPGGTVLLYRRNGVASGSGTAAACG